MAPIPEVPTSNLNNLSSPSDDASPSKPTRSTPKTRNKFTMSHDVKKVSNLSSSEVIALKQVEEDLSKGRVTRSSYPFDDHPRECPGNDSSIFEFGALVKHGSLENIYHPTNHRLGDCSMEQKKKTVRSPRKTPTTSYAELKAAKVKASRKSKDDAESAVIPNKTIEPSPDAFVSNETLMQALDFERKRCLKQKVAAAFMTEGMKRRDNLLIEMGTHIEDKTRECAARLILHHLLLNSWRHVHHDLKRLTEENSQLMKSSENLSLQLRVVRHLQNSEKERIVGKINEINSLKNEIEEMKNERLRYSAEAEKIEGELNELQYKVELLNEEKYDIQKKLIAATERNDLQQQNLEKERKRCDKHEGENFDLKRQANEYKKEARELTAQSSQWQERARAFESELWEIKLQLETKDKNIAQLEATCTLLQNQHKEISTERSRLESKLLKALESTEVARIEKVKVEGVVNQLKVESQGKTEELQNLKEQLELKSKELNRTVKELNRFRLRNVRQRREWGKLLYFVFSPFLAVCELCSFQ